jgi:hypothetical protein
LNPRPVCFNTQAGEYSRVNLQIVVVHSTAEFFDPTRNASPLSAPHTDEHKIQPNKIVSVLLIVILLWIYDVRRIGPAEIMSCCAQFA